MEFRKQFAVATLATVISVTAPMSIADENSAAPTMPMMGNPQQMPMMYGQQGNMPMMGSPQQMPMMYGQRGCMMNPQMMHYMMNTKYQHMQRMEAHLANIEARLGELVALQRAK